MAHAKKQRRKENREPGCVMLGAEQLLCNTPCSRPGEEKELGMRWVNTRSLRFANCMECEKRRDARGWAFGSYRTQQRGTRTPRSSTRTRTHRNRHRSDER